MGDRNWSSRLLLRYLFRRLYGNEILFAQGEFARLVRRPSISKEFWMKIWFIYGIFTQSGACELPRVEARTLASLAGVPFDCDLRNRVASQSRVSVPFPRGNAEFLSPRNFRASIVKLQRDTPRRANCCSDWWIAYFGTGWRNVLERRGVSRDVVTFQRRLVVGEDGSRD